MKNPFSGILIAWVSVAALFFAATCVNYANAKEPTTLEEALERPVKVEKYVDKENNVVCYWTERYPEYISCLQINDVSSADRAK